MLKMFFSEGVIKTLIVSVSLIVCAIIFALSSRYSLSTQHEGLIFRLDKWTGELLFMEGIDGYEVVIERKSVSQEAVSEGFTTYDLPAPPKPSKQE